MRILHTGDWHGDKSTAGISRFEDVDRAVKQSVDHAIRTAVDLYCFTGDLTDPDSGSVVFRVLDLALWTACTLARHGIPSWWIPGNHDVDNAGGHTLAPLKPLVELNDQGFAAVRVFDEPTIERRACFTGVLLPYPIRPGAYDPAAWLRANRPPDDGVPVFVAGHMTALEGVPDGEETLEMPRGQAVPFPMQECDPRWLLCNGHWHARQTYQSGGRKVHICGSLARLTFGEERNVPSFNVYTLE